MILEILTVVNFVVVCLLAYCSYKNYKKGE